MDLSCEKCGLSLPAINSLYYHLLIAHNLDKNDPLTCHKSSCFRKYRNWKEYRRHLINVHGYSVNPSANDDVVVNEQGADHSSNSPVNCPQKEPTKSTDREPTLVQAAEDIESSITEIIFRFTAKLYADHNMPRSSVQSLIEDSADLVNEIISVVKPALTAQLKDAEISDSVLEDTEALFMSIQRPFVRVSTEYRRFQAFAETGDLIMPNTYVVGDRVDDVVEKGRIVKKITNVTATRVPMDRVLKKFLELPGVLISILKYMDTLNNETEIISNFIQCQLWKDKREHFVGKTVLPLFLYYDDFEINNPLGSHKGVHKLGAVYYSIPCLPPEFCSTVDNIFLSLLFHAADRQEFGNEKFFQVVVKDLNFLQEEGIVVNVNGKEQKVYFALGLILGDNLGLNSSLDFVASFNANHYCRLCTLNKDQCRQALREHSEKMRQVNDYERDLALGEEMTGVKIKSVWNKVKHYHVYRNPAMCTLHDYYEGLCRHSMPLVNFHYICKIQPASDRLSLEVLNSRIKSFGFYNKGLSNAPPLISSEDIRKKILPMSGSEMKTYVLVFSMLVGDIVPHDDVWRYYILLRKIIDIVSARYFYFECPKYINCLVEEHHQMYLKVFGDDGLWLKPKEHFMTHSGTVMKESGPLVHLSTIRFESKHKPKMREAIVCNSRVNVTYTLAVKEQLALCYRFLRKEGLTPKNTGGQGIPCDKTSLGFESSKLWTKLPQKFRTKLSE